MVEPAPVNLGDVLAGKYRVERVLGVGGMGVVVAATHLELGQLVALKFLLPAAEANAEATARFIREARAAVRISSEHVARVTDVGRLENGSPYMVMEYLDGVDLGEHVKGALLPIETAVDFVLQACEAIAVAHALGIVHRDLKPANLFVTMRPDGSALIKVLDFGISKVAGVADQHPSLTKTSAVMGSPLYMSPEQMKSARNVDVRTDIWALGTILHELIAGSPPFGGESLGEVFAAVMTLDVKPLRTLRPDTPEGLERLVLRALEKDPERRISNVAELAVALAPFAPARSHGLVARVQGVMGRVGVSSMPPAPPEAAAAVSVPGSATSGVSATDTSWAHQSARRSRNAKRPLVFGAAAVVALAGVALLVARGTHASDPAATPAASALSVISAVPAVPPSAVASVPAPVVAPLLAQPTPSSESVAVTAGSVAPPLAASVSAPHATSALHGAAALHTASPIPVPAAPPVPAPAPVPSSKPRNPLSIDFK